MNDSTSHDHTDRRLHCGVVLRVREDECELLRGGRLRPVRYAPMFPSPRTERVRPGHLVAMTAASDGIETVLWRWYDAVVLGDGEDAIRLWEPAHGEVLAQPRAAYTSPGSPVPVRTCPPDSLARTGGSPVPQGPKRRTPTSSWARSRSFTPSTDCGTP
jgi:hypothetical protein